jgi:hypothetical protein
MFVYYRTEEVQRDIKFLEAVMMLGRFPLKRSSKVKLLHLLWEISE